MGFFIIWALVMYFILSGFHNAEKNVTKWSNFVVNDFSPKFTDWTLKMHGVDTTKK